MRKRFKTRGAAMVEAAVVIPVMVSFLAVIGLMKNGYDRKIQMNQQSRSQVLDYASHNCKSQTITYSDTSQSQGTGLNAGATGSSDSTAAGAQATVGGPSTSGIMAKAEVAYQASSVQSSRNGIKGRAGLSLRVNGEKSVALCNEVPQDGNISGVLGYAKGKLGSLTGR
jgi:hypothetical protein